MTEELMPQHKSHSVVDLEPVSVASNVVPMRRDPTAEDIAAAFLLGYSGSTRASYGRDLATWFTWCADRSLDPLKVARAHVDGWARQLGEIDGYSPASVARRLSTLAGFYRYASNEGLIARSPVAGVRRPKVGDDSTSTGLDRDELHALIARAREDGLRSHALVLVLGLNGLRITEALSIDVGDLDTERGHRVVRITRKGGKRATVPLAPRTAEAVDEYVAGREYGPLFTTATGNRWQRSEAWRTLRRLARDAVPGKAGSLHPHDLRHAFVTLSLDAGASLHDVQDAAGHADPRTTQRYNRARFNLDKHPTYALAGLV
jgi:site-specific recombinase XerD